jgi:hypothetical protein
MKNIGKVLKVTKLKHYACAGLYLEAAAMQEVSPGSILHLKLETTNRSAVPIKLVSATLRI